MDSFHKDIEHNGITWSQLEIQANVIQYVPICNVESKNFKKEPYRFHQQVQKSKWQRFEFPSDRVVLRMQKFNAKSKYQVKKIITNLLLDQASE